MKKRSLKKTFVLLVLFILPLLFYIYLQISTHNFVKLPVKISKINDVTAIDSDVSFKNRVSAVVFLGTNVGISDVELFNLNEKIYNNFYGYPDFQLVLVLPKGTEERIENLKKQTVKFKNTDKMMFVFGNRDQIKQLHDSFRTNKTLNDNLYCSEAYIIDKKLSLRRGVTKDKLDIHKSGYKMSSVAELNGEMKDDIKILLAEYRFALKENGEVRRKI